MLSRFVRTKGLVTSILLWFDYKSSEKGGDDGGQGCVGDSRFARKSLLDNDWIW